MASLVFAGNIRKRRSQEARTVCFYHHEAECAIAPCSSCSVAVQAPATTALRTHAHVSQAGRQTARSRSVSNDVLFQFKDMDKFGCK